MRKAAQPTLRQVQEAVFMELQRTDHFMLADYPIDDDARDDWKQYRIWLRNMSKYSKDPVELIRDCDPAPDGVDPVADLRERL